MKSNSTVELKGVSVNIYNLEKIKHKLRAFLHPDRQRILKAIDKAGETAVSPLYHQLKMEQSMCSLHLLILRNNGFVSSRREGKKKIYSISKGPLQLLSSFAHYA